MKDLRFDGLYSPEYYMDVPGNDGRIAVKKFNDARDTMGMAHFSLSYIEDSLSDDLGKNFAKTIHLRHAIEELKTGYFLQNVSKDYIEGSGKPFTVRSLCNTLKHNHALSFVELYEPYEFNLNVNGKKIDFRKAGLGVRFEQRILEKENPDIEVGKIKYDYVDDLSIDYEYNQGETFRYVDCTNANQRLKIQEVYKECCDYSDALVDLFEDVYNEIHSQIGLLPSLVTENGKSNIKPSSNKISMNDYFTVV